MKPSPTYSLYWIHLESHSNPITQGYIGATKNIDKRFRDHMRNSHCSYIRQAIANGEELICDVLFNLDTSEELYAAEKVMRPTELIGWNIIPGGVQPPVMFGKDNPMYGRNDQCAYFYSQVNRDRVSAMNSIRNVENNPAKTPEAKAKIAAGCQQIVECPHCLLTGGSGGMRRWHFDNCQGNPALTPTTNQENNK